MGRPKKKVSFNEQLLLELEEIAETLGKRFSDVVNEILLLGLDAYKRAGKRRITDEKGTKVCKMGDCLRGSV